jgi:hypothetical protein
LLSPKLAEVCARCDIEVGDHRPNNFLPTAGRSAGGRCGVGLDRNFVGFGPLFWQVPLTEVAACPHIPSIYEIRSTSAGSTPALIGDAQTQGELRKLAADYVEQAALIESKEKSAGVTGGL